MPNDEQTAQREADCAPTADYAAGDYVNYKRGRGQLRCGCGSYERAIVVSLSPFILVSEWGDMRWSATVTPEDFEKVGEAGREELMRVVDRLKRELWPHNEGTQRPGIAEATTATAAHMPGSLK